MSCDFAVKAEGLGKRYQLYDSPQDRLKQALWRGKRTFFREFWALRDVSFTLPRGQALGVLGRNGAGKSTLLQILTGTLPPTLGRVAVNGRVAALLELGSGFDPEFTGRENVYLNGAILGFSRKEIDRRFAEIEAFADIGDFIAQPVKHYSSGMFVRLAFAVQACLEPDVLIVDEALAVGDIFFQQKCHAHMETLLSRGCSLLLVTHDTTAIAKYCNQALLLREGRPLYLGHPAEAISKYYHIVTEFDPSQLACPSLADFRAPLLQAGDGLGFEDWPASEAFLDLAEARVVGGVTGRVTGVAVTDALGRPRMSFEIGEEAVFWMEFEALTDLMTPMAGVTLLNEKNIAIHSKTSFHHLAPAPPSAPRGSRIRVKQTIRMDVASGQYLIDVGLAIMRPEIYARLPNLSHQEFMASSQAVTTSILAASPLAVIPRRSGLPIPFAGYVDLPGDCQIRLVA